MMKSKTAWYISTGSFRRSLWLIALLFFPCCLLTLLSPRIATGAAAYRFERMWPALPQPWYFDTPSGIASDRDGFLYIADTGHHRVVKLDRSGRLVTAWGRRGEAEGEFIFPAAITLGPDDLVYVADRFPGRRVQWFTRDGTYQGSFTMTGSPGNPGIAVDSDGLVHVADSLTVQSYDKSGVLNNTFSVDIFQAGGFFTGITLDSQDNLYISTRSNVLVYDRQGNILRQWEHAFSADELGCITTDPEGMIRVVTETFDNGWEQLIAAYTSAGDLQSQQKIGRDLRAIRGTDAETACGGLTVNPIDGLIYIPEATTGRVLRMDTTGETARYGSTSEGTRGFDKPGDVAVAPDGSVFVTDGHNHRVLHFSPAGQLVGEWGGFGLAEGQFDQPGAIAVALDGSIYVRDANSDQDVFVDTAQERIQHFSADGEFLDMILGGPEGGPGLRDTRFPDDLAVDSNGVLYYLARAGVPDRIYKYSDTGVPPDIWPAPDSFTDYLAVVIGPDDSLYVVSNKGFDNNLLVMNSAGEVTKTLPIPLDGFHFEEATAIAVGNDGKIAVFIRSSVLSDTSTDRIIVLSPEGELLYTIATFGTGPGLISDVGGLAGGPGGRWYVADTGNNRIQSFRPVEEGAAKSKAIIVAGGGPFPGNHLWDATQAMANFAYRTLSFQGFTRETIHYLSSATDLDLDGNGVADEVDGGTTKAALQAAITGWAADADEVVIYLTDHGGDRQFRLSGTETVSAEELDGWLDQLQSSMPGKVMVIYDACESGSFIIPSAAANRIVVTSSSPQEPAYFTGQGLLSFSNFFWSGIFNGRSLGESFSSARLAVEGGITSQFPLLDSDGNGSANEAGDLTAVASRFIGAGTGFFLDAPVIGSVSAPQAITDISTATIEAYGVHDNDGVARVWAVLTPPDFLSGSSSNPVTEMPTLELTETPAGSGNYSGSYNGFTTPGIYQAAIYALDGMSNSAGPLLTTITVGNPLTRRAVLVAGGESNDANWPAREKAAAAAYQALKFQGYKDSELAYYSATTVSGPEQFPTLGNLAEALSPAEHDGALDLVLFMTGDILTGGFRMNDDESLSAAELAGWLDALNAVLPGQVTLIVDGAGAGAFVDRVFPASGHTDRRIRIASTTGRGPATFAREGALSFSTHFWQQVANGARLRDTFIQARNAMQAATGQLQVARLDADGDGDSDKYDLVRVQDFSLGPGILLAGDAPIIGQVNAPLRLTDGGTEATLFAEQVTATGGIARVFAVITPPVAQGDTPPQALPAVDLPAMGSGRYEVTTDLFGPLAGSYHVAIQAEAPDGTLSFPAATSVFQEIGPDAYEEDDSHSEASVIVVNGVAAQEHTFDTAGDADWVSFYAVAGQNYEIKAANVGSQADIMIELFHADGVTPVSGGGGPLQADDGLAGESELLSFAPGADQAGIYFIRVHDFDAQTAGTGTDYELRIDRPIAPDLGTISGLIRSDQITLNLSGAVVLAGVTGAALIRPDGSYELRVEAGSVDLTVLIEGQAPIEVRDIEVQADETTDLPLDLDADRDADGVPDLRDAFPDDPDETLDTDADGTGNNADADDDADGAPDASDAFPLDGTETSDTDTDGTGNNADTDDDGDGLPDVDENNLGTNPLNPDTDSDGLTDPQELDAGRNPKVNEAVIIQIINSTAD